MQALVSEQFGMLAQFLPIMSGPAAYAVETTSYRVVIMEGSRSLARLLATGLKAESLAVEVAQDLESVHEELSSRSANLLILDLDLPDLDGPATLDNLRQLYPDVAILVLSARSGVDGLVSALDHGADDYLQKPFSLLELMARVRVFRRRAEVPASKPAARSTKLVLDREQSCVERDGRRIELTPREFALLEYLVQNPGKTLSRAMLTQEVWNMPMEANTNIVDVYIKYLRDKVDGQYEQKLIRTVRGLGYVFQN